MSETALGDIPDKRAKSIHILPTKDDREASFSNVLAMSTEVKSLFLNLNKNFPNCTLVLVFKEAVIDKLRFENM